MGVSTFHTAALPYFLPHTPIKEKTPPPLVSVEINVILNQRNQGGTRMSNVLRPEGGYGASDYERRARAGMSLSEAGRDMGVSREAVRQMSVKYGIQFADGRKTENEAKYLELHSLGMPNDKIAEACSVTSSTVSAFFSSRGISANKITRSIYSESLTRMANQGYTTSQAAKALGISQSRVSILCRSLGLKLRDGRRKQTSL